jgi:hypothetical protein
MKTNMHKIFFAFICLPSIHLVQAQKVGIGTTIPVAKLEIRGTSSIPSIPGLTSTGIIRIAVSGIEGIDIGKMNITPFSGWIQAGYDGTAPDPLSLQPLGGSVGIGTTSPVSSAVLDLNSTIRGFLPPRMTMANRNNIVNPTEGLMIWCNNCGIYGQIQVFNGNIWTNMTGGIALAQPALGDNDGGGKVAYILQSGDPGYIAGEIHGLIAAPDDQSSEIEWGCYGTGIAGADGTGIGAGNPNTIDILNGCSTAGIAARLCSELILGGYSDWYLPSKNELNRLYLNRMVIGGFDLSADYWSSSEFDNNSAWYQYFGSGFQNGTQKNFNWNVRAIRAF